ncbi:MAG TPA: hypothetical protein VKN99_26905 [Polyangia bacterium]|nr:hypothetical protein [Polyangia bacterium]
MIWSWKKCVGPLVLALTSSCSSGQPCAFENPSNPDRLADFNPRNVYYFLDEEDNQGAVGVRAVEVLVLLGQDRCRAVRSDVMATVNGVAMPLFQNASVANSLCQCTVLFSRQVTTSDQPLAAAVDISDASDRIHIEVPQGLFSHTLSPAPATLSRGQNVTITVGPVAEQLQFASVAFRSDRAGDVQDYEPAALINGHDLTFAVPPAMPAGPGEVWFQLIGELSVTQCEGAPSCRAYTLSHLRVPIVIE